jgi:hypothetical protein
VLIAGGIGHDRKFTLVDQAGILFHSSVVLVYPEIVGDIDPHYLLAVLNSSTFWSFVRLVAPTMGEGRHAYRIEMLKSFPLFLPHSPAERDACAQVAELGRRLLLPTISEKERRDSIREADRRVAELYGVTKLLSTNMLRIRELRQV